MAHPYDFMLENVLNDLSSSVVRIFFYLQTLSAIMFLRTPATINLFSSTKYLFLNLRCWGNSDFIFGFSELESA